jgi:hypothetical protein
MDALFHHVRGWSRHHHQVGQLSILSKMDMIESALHHLMNDVGMQQASAPGAGQLSFSHCDVPIRRKSLR